MLRRITILTLPLVTLTTSASAQSTQEQPKQSSVHGSFQPPLNDPTNEATYLFATGILAFADPVTLYGVIAGAGRGFGSAEHPKLGFEAGAIALTGGGSVGARTSAMAPLVRR